MTARAGDKRAVEIALTQALRDEETARRKRIALQEEYELVSGDAVPAEEPHSEDDLALSDDCAQKWTEVWGESAVVPRPGQLALLSSRLGGRNCVLVDAAGGGKTLGVVTAGLIAPKVGRPSPKPERLNRPLIPGV